MRQKVFLLVAVVVVCGKGWGVSALPATPLPHPPPVFPAHLNPESCPPTYEEHPLVLVSLDGFRVEYLRRGLTPTLKALRGRGVSAPYMKPSFPSITFPNHYTIVTGLYPGAHGIVANKFYDPSFDKEFRVGREESFKKRWWGGEPIWRTLARQGKKAASFFWPGSEVTDRNPSYWYFYNESIPFTHRVQKVLAWLDLPPETRPSFITLYLHEPDRTGHDFGPNSPQMNAKLVQIDGVMGQLVEGLKSRNLLQCVNLLVVADHGMVDAGDEKLINLATYLPGLPERARFWDGAFVRFTPHNETTEAKESMMRALACKRKELRVYERELLPVRWHMGGQKRVEEVVVEVDPGYSVGGDATFDPDEGEHGYDGFFPSMNALFLGYGPDLAAGKEVEAFQNIELYNLMCDLLGVSPAPNNGTWGALHHLMASPPPPPPQEERVIPQISRLPQGSELDTSTLSASQCEGDERGTEGGWVQMLRDAEGRKEEVLKVHLPWGAPERKAGDAVLLVNPDSVIAYSPRVKLPLWTSFSVPRRRGAPRGEKRKEEEEERWRSDPRLRGGEAPSCPAYGSLKGMNVSREPLFPDEFSCKGPACESLPYLISNAVPLTRQAARRWRELLTLVARWRVPYGPLNVVAGPVMDYDGDTVADEEMGRGEHLVAVPTHLFLVVTRCVAPVSGLHLCPHHKLDSLAFVFPQLIPVTNCLDSARFAQEYSAKVKDVEAITGLRLFPEVPYYDQAKLRIRMHSNIWGHESWANRLLDNFLHP
ncbi:venom phosphodiesterase-like isoform X2 [Eriocheir sinensis]|uniref:venom phosphodiesterase-like isoform X2 n=1 Tax=Eriocheir sinensis TaxID=95602 RepID=UPI0021C6F447|nr:venom phosphodiesterase-like isoform X2 [Eriocheir sinensis]